MRVFVLYTSQTKQTNKKTKFMFSESFWCYANHTLHVCRTHNHDIEVNFNILSKIRV